MDKLFLYRRNDELYGTIWNPLTTQGQSDYSKTMEETTNHHQESDDAVQNTGIPYVPEKRRINHLDRVLLPGSMGTSQPANGKLSDSSKALEPKHQ